jgi:uncharacterized radical SAM protein YgiQ
LLDLYRDIDQIKEVKKSFIGSGIRYDLFMNEDIPEDEKKNMHIYIKELLTKHISGRLKVAPEHKSDNVLKIMRKPSFELFKKFNILFEKINRENGLSQQLIPYFISSHPGSTEKNMAELAVETKKLHFELEQVQDFTPTPMTLATVIYYSGVNPYTMQPVYTARSKEEKQFQRMYFFHYKPDMHKEIEKRLNFLGLKSIKEKLFQKKIKN